MNYSTKKLSLVLVSLFCIATATQAMDNRRREIPLHAAYRLITQKLKDVQADANVKRTIQKEVRATILQRAKNNRIAKGNAESIINNALMRFGFVNRPDTQDDQDLARALALSLKLQEEKKSHDLARQLLEKEQKEQESLEIARRLQEQEKQQLQFEQEQRSLETAYKLQQEQNQQLKRTQEKSDLELARRLQEQRDLELARREQEQLDRDLARRLQQNNSHEKLSNTITTSRQSRKKTPSARRQMSTYRARQQQRSQGRTTTTTTRTTQSTSSTSNSSIQNGVFTPRTRRTQQQVQKPTYAPFNHTLGTQLNLPGITRSLKLPGVYHVFSNAYIPQQRRWACAFHVLYNACKIEQVFLGKNVSDMTFIRTCQSMASKINISGTDTEIYATAHSLGLSNVKMLFTENGAIKILTSSGTRAYFDGDALKVALDRDKIIHFVGCITSHNVPHAVLLSVVKQQNGSKALYIFDNINGDEDNGAQEQICKLAQTIYDKIMR